MGVGTPNFALCFSCWMLSGLIAAVAGIVFVAMWILSVFDACNPVSIVSRDGCAEDTPASASGMNVVYLIFGFAVLAAVLGVLALIPVRSFLPGLRKSKTTKAATPDVHVHLHDMRQKVPSAESSTFDDAIHLDVESEMDMYGDQKTQGTTLRTTL